MTLRVPPAGVRQSVIDAHPGSPTILGEKRRSVPGDEPDARIGEASGVHGPGRTIAVDRCWTPGLTTILRQEHEPLRPVDHVRPQHADGFVRLTDTDDDAVLLVHEGDAVEPVDSAGSRCFRQLDAADLPRPGCAAVQGAEHETLASDHPNLFARCE